MGIISNDMMKVIQSLQVILKIEEVIMKTRVDQKNKGNIYLSK